MFKKNPKPIYFEFEKPVLRSIHSFYVRCSFVAIWLDENDKVIESRIIEPCEKGIIPSRPFTKLLEIPL